MKLKTKLLLTEAQIYCDENDKSTEYMLQYMQDHAGVSLDCVINFLTNKDVQTSKPKSEATYGGLGSEMDTNSMNYNNLKL